MKLTQKESKRLNALINKALSPKESALNASEIKELKAILNKLEDKSENEKYSMGDKFDLAFELVRGRNVLELAEGKAFEALSLKEKLKRLNKQIDDGIAFTEERTEKLTKELEEKEFERFYAEHEKTHGKYL